VIDVDGRWLQILDEDRRQIERIKKNSSSVPPCSKDGLRYVAVSELNNFEVIHAEIPDGAL
jgi:hypothetical protein